MDPAELIKLAEILERDGDEHGVGAALRGHAANAFAAAKVAEWLARRPAGDGCTEPCAAQPVLPSGWSVRKDGDEIRVTAPNCMPGGMALSPAAIYELAWESGMYDPLPSRLLYALCDALLTPPHEDPASGDDASEPR